MQIGRSSAGLVAAILLRRSGYRVHVSEQAKFPARVVLAASISLTDRVRTFMMHDHLIDSTTELFNDSARILHLMSLKVLWILDFRARMTSWVRYITICELISMDRKAHIA